MQGHYFLFQRGWSIAGLGFSLVFLCCHPLALPVGGYTQTVRGWGVFTKGLQSKTQSTKVMYPAPLFSPRVPVRLCVSVPTWNQKQQFLDSEVTAVTNFKPRSQSTGSQENFNENGFLIWTKLRAFAVAEERLGCLWPENPSRRFSSRKNPIWEMSR